MVAAISIFTLVYLFTGIIYFGAKKEQYSHLKHTISELGEAGSKNEKSVSYGLFLPVGILMFLIAVQSGANEIVLGLSASIGAGYTIAAFFPCDAGSPLGGSWRQQVHNLGGLIQYAGGFIFLSRASEKDVYLFSVPYKIIAFILIVCIIFISIPQNPVRGMVQRVAEVLLFAALLHLVACN